MKANFQLSRFSIFFIFLYKLRNGIRIVRIKETLS